MLRRDLEDQLVVELEHEPRPPARVVLGPKARDHRGHRALDEVGGGALDDRVEGLALGLAPPLGIGRVDVREPAPPAQHRLHEPVLAARRGHRGPIRV